MIRRSHNRGKPFFVFQRGKSFKIFFSGVTEPKTLNLLRKFPDIVQIKSWSGWGVGRDGNNRKNHLHMTLESEKFNFKFPRRSAE
jgi:hypothetical protein